MIRNDLNYYFLRVYSKVLSNTKKHSISFIKGIEYFYEMEKHKSLSCIEVRLGKFNYKYTNTSFVFKELELKDQTKLTKDSSVNLLNLLQEV
jgi:hypothetical protein